MKLCFATHNEHKLREIQEMLPTSIQLVDLNTLGIHDPIAETGDTIEENSGIKARFVYAARKEPVFADDTGLIVPSLNGEPGVYSARYAGPERSDEANIDKLLNRLTDQSDRSAYFLTVITFIDGEGKETTFEGRIDGRISDQRLGTEGFGYDPVFIPEHEERTFAQMRSSEKHAISHRGRAFNKLTTYLREQYG